MIVVLMLKTLLDRMIDEQKPDINRIYVNYISNGGHMPSS